MDKEYIPTSSTVGELIWNHIYYIARRDGWNQKPNASEQIKNHLGFDMKKGVFIFDNSEQLSFFLLQMDERFYDEVV